MGANASKSVQAFHTELSNNLDVSSIARSTSDCEISGNRVTYGKANNCPITMRNQCTSEATADLDSVAETAAKMWLDASTKQKASFLPGVNVDISEQEVTTIIRNTINAKCEADADTRANINSNEIRIDECINTPVEFVNVGNATGQCAVNLVTKTIAENQASKSSDQSGSDFPLTTILLGIAGIIALVVIMMMVMSMAKKGRSSYASPPAYY